MIDLRDIEIANQKYIFYRAVIENNVDPLKMGRVQVRIIGLHSDNIEEIPTITLPWAEVLSPTMFGMSTGIGVSSVPLKGTWVWVFFERGDNSKPVVMGTTMGNSTPIAEDVKSFCDPDKKFPLADRVNESDFNRIGRNENLDKVAIIKKMTDNRDKTEISGVEVEPILTNDKSVYPFCSVIETQSGHLIEVDDTEGNERIRITHKTGSYLEIKPDGSIVTKSVKNKHDITTENVFEHIIKGLNTLINENRTTTIKQDDKYSVDGNVTNTIKGNITENVSGNNSTTISGKKTESVSGAVSENYSGGQKVNGGSSIEMSAGKIKLSGSIELG